MEVVNKIQNTTVNGYKLIKVKAFEKEIERWSVKKDNHYYGDIIKVAMRLHRLKPVVFWFTSLRSQVGYQIFVNHKVANTRRDCVEYLASMVEKRKPTFIWNNIKEKKGLSL